MMETIDKMGENHDKWDIMMVRKLLQKSGIKQLRTLAGNVGILQIGRKCLENKIQNGGGVLQKVWVIFYMRDSGF